MNIRLYEKRDRPAVRQISCDTADRGEPVDRIFQDREGVADVLTRYYTDYEPGSLWVAEHEGRVVGYLTGCLDSRRCNKIVTWCVVPKAVLRALFRGTLICKQAWPFFKSVIVTVQRSGLPPRVPLDRYPAHLHFNVKEGFRGVHVGQRLVEKFFQQVKAAGLCGVHAWVREDSVGACRFSERQGFEVIASHPMVLFYRDGRRVEYKVRLYGKSM